MTVCVGGGGGERRGGVVSPHRQTWLKGAGNHQPPCLLLAPAVVTVDGELPPRTISGRREWFVKMNIIIIMYIYNAPIDVLSTHGLHIKPKAIVCIYVKHMPTDTNVLICRTDCRCNTRKGSLARSR